MSYDPSHRKPPRQERWPQATPPEGWPAAGYPRQAGHRRASGGSPDRGYRPGVATDTFAPARNGYGGNGNGNGYGGNGNGYGGNGNGTGGYGTGGYGGGRGYGSGIAGYGRAADGLAGAQDDFAGSAGYLAPPGYAEPAPSGPMLVAPDAGVYPDSWQADQDRRRDAGRRGLIVGAVTGFLAVAVAIAASTLAAAFVRPQSSLMIALGGVFIDRTPAALKSVIIRHFGAHDKTVLLLGMYVAIAVLAVAIGVMSRRTAALGVAGLAAFSLFGAFVAITRPGSRVTDLAPSVIGGIAGVAALIWLARASVPVAPVRRANHGGRRRTR